MQDHQQRVVDEEAALSEKISKLEAFMLIPLYGQLPTDERMRLRRQLRHMWDYVYVLRERIAAW